MNDSIAILAVDDEPNARTLLQVALRQQGYQCLHASTGLEAVSTALHCEPSLVLLDLGLPDIDGVEVVVRIRERSRMPIIALSARSAEDDKIAALDAGANDYVTKPFFTGELLARVRAALRSIPSRENTPPSGTVSIGELSVDFDARRVTVRGAALSLSPVEYRLLGVLARSAGRVVTHQQILREVWGARYAGQINYLRVYMNKLRHKIERSPAQPRYLVNEPGVGYRLRLPE